MDMVLASRELPFEYDYSFFLPIKDMTPKACVDGLG